MSLETSSAFCLINQVIQTSLEIACALLYDTAVQFFLSFDCTICVGNIYPDVREILHADTHRYLILLQAADRLHVPFCFLHFKSVHNFLLVLGEG